MYPPPSGGAYPAFNEEPVSSFFRRRTEELARTVGQEDNDALLSMDEAQYIDCLVARFRVDPLVLEWDQKWQRAREEKLEGERFPGSTYNVERMKGQRFRVQVIAICIPYSGEPDLLRCRPSSSSPYAPTVTLEQGCLCFEVRDYAGREADTKAEADRNIRVIEERAATLARDVAGFNCSLTQEASRIVKDRKQELLRRRKTLALLGFPIQKRDDVPEAFAVPIHRKPLRVKPTPATAEPRPEPFLGEADYQAILEIIHDMGVSMERLPSIYLGKGEESLRDLFLMVLSIHFESATGETFNRNGHTDILIRHQNSNVFVAECKVWDGMAKFHDAIDQLLKYLTWRDSKSAIVLFVTRQNLDPVLRKIRAETECHPCFVRQYDPVGEAWFKFEFHFPQDETRTVQTSVLCFHVPPI